MTETEIYCMKCKQKKIVNAIIESKNTSKGKKFMYKANCPDCDTKMCKMTSDPDKKKN